MLKQMAERESKAEQDLQKKREMEARNKTLAKQALNFQVREKEQTKLLTRENDARFADQVAKKVSSIEQQEQKDRLVKEKVKKDYFNDLNAQIKSEKQRKKYDILMTEHERRVHDKTIKAYEQFETENSSGGLKIGQNYAAIQQKYIGKAFGSSPIQSPVNLNEVVNVSAYSKLPSLNTNNLNTIASNGDQKTR